MKSLGLAQAELAAKLGMPRVAVNAIINGKRSVTPGTAMRLAKALGTTSEFWINGQLAVDPEPVGTLIRPAAMRDLAYRAGYADAEILPIEHPAWRFYRLVS